MKILFIARFFYPQFGGGEVFVHNALKYLVKKGYECIAICFYDGHHNQPFARPNKQYVDGIKILQHNSYRDKEVEEIYKIIKPNLIITQSTDSLLFLQIAKKLNIPTMFGVHFYNEIITSKEQYYSNVLNDNFVNIEKARQEVFHIADKFYVNSQFMYDVVKKYVGLEPNEIIYPPIDLEKVVAKDKDPKMITYVNPCVGKGMGVFRNIASSLPRYKFNLVGTLVDRSVYNYKVYEDLMRLKNTEVSGHISSMSEIYKYTKILLMPSLVDETCSMTTMEAFFNGIPVIAAPHGNLSYFVKKDMLLPINEIGKWLEKIKQLMSNQEFYKQESQYVLEESKKYDPEIQCKKFETLALETMNK